MFGDNCFIPLRTKEQFRMVVLYLPTKYFTEVSSNELSSKNISTSWEILLNIASCVSVMYTSENLRLTRRQGHNLLACEGESWITKNYAVVDYVIRDKEMRILTNPDNMSKFFYDCQGNVSRFYPSGWASWVREYVYSLLLSLWWKNFHNSWNETKSGSQ